MNDWNGVSVLWGENGQTKIIVEMWSDASGSCGCGVI